jgi:prevent-host-death family protein
MTRSPNVRIAEDIISVSELKAHAAKWLERAAETDAPLVVTQNGRAAGVLVSPRMYDALVEQGRLALAVGEGLEDAKAGRVHSHASLKRELVNRYRNSPDAARKKP